MLASLPNFFLVLGLTTAATVDKQRFLAKRGESSLRRARYVPIDAKLGSKADKLDLDYGEDQFTALWKRDNETRHQKGLNKMLTMDEARALYIPKGYHTQKPVRINGKVYYGQELEDEYLNREFFKNQQGGTFVEMGGFNGVKCSNSLFFEESLGWKGLLVEPVPESYRMLRFNRPNAIAINKAVCETPTKIKMNAASTLTNEAIGTNQKRDYKESGGEVDVDCIPLAQMLHSTGFKKIDFFSLDVEGLEMSALKSMDWKIPVRTWLIETVMSLPKEYSPDGAIKGGIRRYLRDLHELMESKGFRCHAKAAMNEVWVNANYPNMPILDAHREPIGEGCRVACGLAPDCKYDYNNASN